MFKKLSLFLKLTETELKVLLFLAVTLLTGYSYKTFFIVSQNNNQIMFDYSEQDSLFFSITDSDIESGLNISESGESVDYKQEVLDFNIRNFSESKSKELPQENSININIAGTDELIRLPGIGLATAEKIIELRNLKGSFKRIDDLLQVKGIGETKLNNIKKYIYIE